MLFTLAGFLNGVDETFVLAANVRVACLDFPVVLLDDGADLVTANLASASLRDIVTVSPERIYVVFLVSEVVAQA